MVMKVTKTVIYVLLKQIEISGNEFIKMCGKGWCYKFKIIYLTVFNSINDNRTKLSESVNMIKY